MGHAVPKQYLRVAGRTLIEHTLDVFRFHPAVRGVVIVIAPQDPYWPRVKLPPAPTLLRVIEGGAERAVSVLNGLLALADIAHDDDWVLVHDAARPCIRTEDVTRLIEVATVTPHGGLLATPVADTLKRSTPAGSVAQTVDRHLLWRALTPQIFPYVALRQALMSASDAGVTFTDEAGAMERVGFSPCLVPGSADNIKVTQEEDLAIVDAILSQRAVLHRESPS